MKLLICTQAVDGQDSDLGFFVRWIEEFAKHCDRVTVICLREGAHSLPENVTVHALKAQGRISRAREVVRFCIANRDAYDHVFVHMNPEYLVVAGLLWRAMGKPTALWYTHKSVDMKLRIATFFANTILTASKESFRLQSTKVRVMGHGIDTNIFTPDTSVPREDFWISAGQLDKVKRHDLAICMAGEAAKKLLIIGDGPERRNLEALARQGGVEVVFLGKLSHAQIRDQFRRASLFLHTSETGSLDKMLLEAVACGCPVRTGDPALKHIESVTPAYVLEHHSLEHLIPAILRVMTML